MVMRDARDVDKDNDRRYQLFKDATDKLPPGVLADPDLPEILARTIDRRLGLTGPAWLPPASVPSDAGLFDMLGLGASAVPDLGRAKASLGVQNYDDAVTSNRILSAADLYYLALHEQIGVFAVMWKLQELFQAGTLRISDGPGAFGLYRFDKHAILRYRLPDRLRAYRRVLGYGRAPAGPNARSNDEFHGLFRHFIGETAKFWRDKRISEVIRERATDPTFGSIAIVRRAGLDLRNNLKNSSYGFVNVLRLETGQVLAEAFKVLDSDDLRAQFGAEKNNPWDLIELVMWQYFGRTIHASAMNRMAVTGRNILRWLSEPYILDPDRPDFEAALYQIAEDAEEWISSAEGMRLSRPTPPPRNVYVASRPGGDGRGLRGREPRMPGPRRPVRRRPVMAR
jgi:hypothetical protein